MPPGRKLGGGCWTCRLRRKRCDSLQPVCGSCQSLNITCHSGKGRPLWMDGGTEQKQMSEIIKKKIKQNAFLQREQRVLVHEDRSIIVIPETDHTLWIDNAPISTPQLVSHASDPVLEGSSARGSAASTLSSGGPAALCSSVEPSEESPSLLTSASSTSDSVTLVTGCSPGSCWPAGLANPINVQLGSVMIYLDYVFPFLFPFYQPSLIETGRQWLLGLLCQNEASFHIAASLSAYFFTLVPRDGEQAMHDDCKALVLNKLVEQMDMAIKSMQNTVSIVSHHGARCSLLEKTRVMEEIIQLLIVEVTIKSNTDWAIHLTPALTLFDEVFKCHSTNGSEPNLDTLLNAFPSPFPVGTLQHKPLPNTADQSAMIFFVSLLLFIDIIASTSLGTTPVLQSYHQSLLLPRGNESNSVRLEAVIGCQNWVLLAIADISALCRWKRVAKQDAKFSVLGLVDRAGPISRCLDEGFQNLRINAAHTRSEGANIYSLQAYYSRHDSAIDDTSIARITQIWAIAARLYLSVSLSGWQTMSDDIQANVSKLLNLLQTIESPAQLRSLSWPICIAGCLALPSQEHSFRRMIEFMGQLVEFGTALDALRIMETVWRSRDTIDADLWDIASCLRSLGSPALLI